MSWISVGWAWYAANSDKVNPIVAGLGGAALVWAAIQQARTATRRHYEQTRADQQRRLTETFSKAAEQLASDKMEARLGGIYTLERLALEAIAYLRPPPWWRRVRRKRQPLTDPVSDLYWTAMETLTAFVRERAKWEEEKTATPAPPYRRAWGPQLRHRLLAAPGPTPPTDINAVLTVIRRRPESARARERQRGWSLDLRATDLRGANLAVADLEYANLTSAHLEGAHLYAAALKRALLAGTYFQGAQLASAHLEGANLEEAHLEEANLGGVSFDRITLIGLASAHGDAKTILPNGVERPAGWPAFQNF